MLPLYAARIEDLGQGDFVKVDCAACQHVALLSPETLLRVWLRPRGFELKGRLRFSGAGGRKPAWFRSSGEGRARTSAAIFRALPEFYGTRVLR